MSADVIVCVVVSSKKLAPTSHTPEPPQPVTGMLYIIEDCVYYIVYIICTIIKYYSYIL